jgi:hypothetical protein
MWYFKVANECSAVDPQDSPIATRERPVSNPNWGTLVHVNAENSPEESGDYRGSRFSSLFS